MPKGIYNHTYWIGKHHSQESKDKISSAKYEKSLPEETKKKISISLMGRIPWNKGLHTK